MDAFAEGTILGLSLAFLFGFGPAFFALIQTGIRRGFFSGALLALGIILNDALVVSLALLGVDKVFGSTENYQLLGLAGGIILVIFGLVTFRKGAETAGIDGELDLSAPHPMSLIAKGFLLNIANPFVWLFWIGTSVGIQAHFKGEMQDVVLFFAGTLSVVFLTDLLKTFLASRLKKLVTDRMLVLINRIAGLALAGFGIYLIIRSFLVF